MNAIIGSDRGGTCGICLDGFDHQDQPITHVGGENHDGFHKKCLAEWVVRHPTCPYDGQSIDTKSLLTRTEYLVPKLRSALAIAAYVASFGAALAMAQDACSITFTGSGPVLTSIVSTAGVGIGSAIATLTVAEIGINRILHPTGISPIDLQNVQLGLGVACVAVPFTSLAASSTIALVGGIAGGILSLIRG